MSQLEPVLVIECDNVHQSRKTVKILKEFGYNWAGRGDCEPYLYIGVHPTRNYLTHSAYIGGWGLHYYSPQTVSFREFFEDPELHLTKNKKESQIL